MDLGQIPDVVVGPVAVDMENAVAVLEIAALKFPDTP
jgi:hypothetical protein